MTSRGKSSFRQLYDLAERYCTVLGSDELRPKSLWLVDEPSALEKCQRALLRAIQDLDEDLRQLAAGSEATFASVLGLDEWQSLEKELPDLHRDVEILRPAADADNCKRRLISIRGRVSELVDRLVVRSVVRDPYQNATNTQEAMKSFFFLIQERERRDTGLGLLEAPTWNEMLDSEVADWSVRFGPEHRIELGRFCHELLENLRAIRSEAAQSPQVARLVAVAEDVADRLDKIRRQVLAIPAQRVDAGVASDCHYMAELAKKLVGKVGQSHRAILDEHDEAGRPLPPSLIDLFELLDLHVPRRRPPAPAPAAAKPRPMSREEIERALGRRLAETSKDQEPRD